MPKTLNDLEAEMRDVAAGRRAPPPPLSAMPADIFSVLTPANLALIEVIDQRRPESVSRLAVLTGRRQSNVSRALQELARWGIVRLVRDARAIRPELAARHLDIDLVTRNWRLDGRRSA